MFLSFMYFLTFEIFGSANMFKLSMPEAVINPYLQNRTALYDAILRDTPTPAYCIKGTPTTFSETVYPEGLEILRSLNTASKCDSNAVAAATLGETAEDGSFFIRTMRVIYDVEKRTYSSHYTLHPEAMTFGFKHSEVSKAWVNGVSTCKESTPNVFENGRLEWPTVSDLFGESNLVGDLLDKSNKDAFAGNTNDGAPKDLPIYRQTGIVFLLVINYFNYPRDISELGYLLTSSNLRASVSVKHVPGLIGRKSPRQIIDPATGNVKHIIYDYGIKLSFVTKGSVGTLSFSSFITCIIRSFGLLFFAGATLNFMTKPWVQYDLKTGADISLEKSKAKKKEFVGGKGGKSGSSNSKSIELTLKSNASNNKTLFDDTIYQIPYVRGLYDDSGHDIERAVRNRTRKAFGLVQDLQIDSQALAPTSIPTTRNSVSNFDMLGGNNNNNNSNNQSSQNMGRNSVAQSVNNPSDLGLENDQIQSLKRALDKIDRLEGALNELKASHNDMQKKVNMQGGHRRGSSMQRASIQSPNKI